MIDIKAIRAAHTGLACSAHTSALTVLALCDEIERLRNASRTETTSVDIEGLREMAQQMEARVGSTDDAAFSARVVLALISVVDELTEIANQTRQTCYGLTNSLRGSSDEIERLQKEVHNLNWALGTEGYTEMATPEEQADHEAGMADVQAIIDRMQAAKDAHEAMEKDAARYRLLRRYPLSVGHGSLQVFMDDRCGSGNYHKMVWDKELDAAIDKQLEERKA